jgi:hypothetical protein
MQWKPAIAAALRDDRQRAGMPLGLGRHETSSRCRRRLAAAGKRERTSHLRNALRGVHAAMDKRRWSDLDPRLRQAMLLAGAVEAGLKIAALIDLAQRPARRVRGSKAGWAVAITVVNAAGAVPIVYLLRGRR